MLSFACFTLVLRSPYRLSCAPQTLLLWLAGSSRGCVGAAASVQRDLHAARASFAVLDPG